MQINTQTSDSTPRGVIILGSTGSVGTQASDVIRRNHGKFQVKGIAAAGRKVQLLAEQVLDLQPEVVAVARNDAEQPLRSAIAAEAARREVKGSWQVPKILTGADGVEQVASWRADVVLNGIDGALGLRSTLAALDAGSILALANKESLIIGGELVTRAARPGQIVPVDSEHAALAQCMRGGSKGEIRRMIITASGGPFHGRRRFELTDVTPAQALAHPTWSMGPLITINSATMVNKGLEVIEAHLLFGISYDQIEVVLHPTSEIHSMVEFHDGAVIAQVSPPDLRLAIALGLAWPKRVPSAAHAFDWTQPHNWQIMPLDHETFPAIELARQVGRAGGTAAAVYNAANEVCVHRFLTGQLPFLAIVDTVAQVVGEHTASKANSVEEVIAADAWARTRAIEVAGRPTNSLAVAGYSSPHLIKGAAPAARLGPNVGP